MTETHDKRTETHACDLISRQDAIDALNKLDVSDGVGISSIACDLQEEAIRSIENLPSAQPDIVACGDCIHWICHDRRCGYWNHGVKPLDWCCHAERRTDG